MRSSKLSLLLLDFDGVLSRGRFYFTLKETHPDLYIKIAETLFSKESWPLVSCWMRGGYSYQDIHKKIAIEVGASEEFLNNALEDSVRSMNMNDKLVEFSQKIRFMGVKVIVFTDNMDIFDKIYVRHAKLLQKFDAVFSSSAYRKLKLDNNAEFISEVIEEMDASPENSLLLDDSDKIGVFMRNKGGVFYHYNNYIEGHRDFLEWFQNNYPDYVKK